MGWNFRKSFKISPGVKLNLSKRGVGMSAGSRGFRVGINSKGKAYTRTSIPGTGIYSYDEYGRSNKHRSVKNESMNTTVKTWEIVVVFLAGISVIAYKHFFWGGFFIIAGIILLLAKILK